MIQPLRPMRLGEILDRTFQIYRERFFKFACISAAAALAMLLFRLADVLWWQINPTDGKRIFGVVDILWVFYLLLFFHVNRLFQFLTFPLTTRFASSTYLREEGSFSVILKSYFGHWKANAGVALLEIGAVLLVPEILLVAVVAGIAALAEALHIDTTAWGPIWSPMMTAAILAGFAAFYWMTSWFGLAWSACSLEGLSAWRAMGRSRRLSISARRRILAAQILPLVLWIALMLALGFASRFLFRELNGLGLRYRTTLWTYRSAILLGQWAIETTIGPLFPIALTLLYYDQRIRKEGFDIEWMMQSAGMTEPAAAPATQSAAPEPASVPVEEAGA
jgi:hypothetical protein